MNHAAKNENPKRTHEGREFHEDSVWHRNKDEPLGVHLALINLQGDWPAMAEFLCCRIWAHLRAPCMCCDIPKHAIKDVDALSSVTLDEFPWALFDDAAWNSEVQKCSLTFIVTDCDAQHQITQNLGYKESRLGRTLLCDLPALGLHAGYRLDPCESLRDVAAFEEQAPPFEVLWWTGGDEDRLTHITPLASIIGFSWAMYGVDILHCWLLGPMQSFVAFCLWHALRCKIFGTNLSWLSLDEENRLGLLQIKNELWAYYRNRRKTDEDWAKRGPRYFWEIMNLIKLF